MELLYKVCKKCGCEYKQRHVKCKLPKHILKDDSHLVGDDGNVSGYVVMLCGQELHAMPDGNFKPRHEFFGAPTNKATCHGCLDRWRKS